MSVVIVEGASRAWLVYVTKFAHTQGVRGKCASWSRGKTFCHVVGATIVCSATHTPRMCSSCMLMAHRSGALLIVLVSCQHEIVVHIVDNVLKHVSFCFDGSPRWLAESRGTHAFIA